MNLSLVWFMVNVKTLACESLTEITTGSIGQKQNTQSMKIHKGREGERERESESKTTKNYSK